MINSFFLWLGGLLIGIAVGIYIERAGVRRDQREVKRVRKIFNSSRNIYIPDYKKDDPRNKTHPEETVRTEEGTSTRKLAEIMEAAKEKLREEK